MWKFALALLVLVAAAAAGLAAWSPSAYRVERSVLVVAPPEALVAQLADLQRWPAWSPAETQATGVARQFGGQPGSPGASAYWSGDGAVGRGRRTVVGVGLDHVDVEQELEEPRHALADLEFRLAPEGTGTRITFTTLGENGLADRLRWHLAGGRWAVEADMEARLGQLKAVTEAEPRRVVRRVERSALVAAPPEAVRSRIADLHGWAGWSPVRGLSAATAISGGPPEGVGASLYWTAGGAEGPGRMTVVVSTPEVVEVEVEVGGGAADRVAASNDLQFRIAPEGLGTRVTWTTTGDGGFEAADLDRGLAKLKAISEARM